MTQTNWNCTSDEWCYAFGKNAYCNSERKCDCSPNTVLDENYICQATGGKLNYKIKQKKCWFNSRFFTKCY